MKPKPNRNKTDLPSGSDLPVALAQPARRALAAAGIQNLAQLARFSEAEVRAMHGIGPNAMNHLRKALDAKGMAFAGDEKGSRRAA